MEVEGKEKIRWAEEEVELNNCRAEIEHVSREFYQPGVKESILSAGSSMNWTPRVPEYWQF
jgi:hypothetical protein